MGRAGQNRMYNTVNGRMFCDFPAKNTVYIHRKWPYIW